ncbi:efflux RND transporter periplasmic adaptor subunit, partial [Pseudomonas aeruginosa]|nr:efflux RND transporter periplasmic adaptor subunit [Pseudomonas aeruginosa]
GEAPYDWLAVLRHHETWAVLADILFIGIFGGFYIVPLYALIHSPINGLVGQRSARNGQYVQVGTHLLSLVPDEDIWVQANFKETQVGRMRDGQKARLTFDAFPDTPIDGRIDSLFAASGAQFSLLPPDNATGNFTKVVQRIPVKIVFDANNPLHGRIRPGMSVEAEVELRDR